MVKDTENGYESVETLTNASHIYGTVANFIVITRRAVSFVVVEMASQLGFTRRISVSILMNVSLKLLVLKIQCVRIAWETTLVFATMGTEVAIVKTLMNVRPKLLSATLMHCAQTRKEATYVIAWKVTTVTVSNVTGVSVTTKYVRKEKNALR